MADIPKRKLGATGAEVSILGLGGSHIGYDTFSDDEAVRLIRSAVDAGINFIDNNWAYNNGRSGERLGAALGDRRDEVFLMTKVDARDRKGALEQLDTELRRMRTDHADLLQLHEIVYPTDPDLVSAPGGALEALDEAKRVGKARFVGFTGHKSPTLHLRMLELYPFDTAQMPLNVMDAHFMSFAQHVIPLCLTLEVGVIGMKPFGDPHIVESGVVTPREALGYALSLPVSTMVTGIDNTAVLEQDIEIARGFAPFSQEELDRILAKTAPLDVSGDGRYELYKTSKQFDADYGRKLHGFPTSDELCL
ncbi:MAG: aldo/keto reductase [Armatimonadota bacterium]